MQQTVMARERAPNHTFGPGIAMAVCCKEMGDLRARELAASSHRRSYRRSLRSSSSAMWATAGSWG